MKNPIQILALMIFMGAMLKTRPTEAQTTSGESRSFSVSIGYVNLKNAMNGDDYYSFKYPNGENRGDINLNGGFIKFTRSTSIEYIDLTAGALFVNDNLAIFSTTDDYVSNGGGVFFGISPKSKGKFIGITSDLALGAFSFKEYIAIYDNFNQVNVDEYDKKSSHGLGGMAGVGFYVKVGRFGLNPSINAIYSGGANASFLFYGYTIPLTIRLTE
jgi:hypothetical protein